jgi:hypothetical protein
MGPPFARILPLLTNPRIDIGQEYIGRERNLGATHHPRLAHQKNEEITASSEDEPSKTVLGRAFEVDHKVMTEAVVGSSPRLFPMSIP